MAERIRVLVIRFENELHLDELEFFRGAVIKAVENRDNLLFHNHLKDGNRYAYPLIQYKRIGGKAAMVCVGEGTEAIGQFFGACNFDVSIGNRKITLKMDRVEAQQVLVQLCKDMFCYRIRKWLPLNQENYEKYISLESLAERYALLERMLVGNILSFAKGMGIRFEGEVECKITDIEEPVARFYKGVKMMSFDAEFKTNVSLPDYIGLGKGVSLGMGMVVRKKDERQ